MMNYTKAQMLQHLKENLECVNILPLHIVLWDRYCFDKDVEIKKILEKFKNEKKLIVRSSSTSEDTNVTSNAGKYKSVLNVSTEYLTLKEAIEEVYVSYDTTENEEILIQPMLDSVSISGVVFTADINTFADYYIINYQVSDNTAAVTSGETGGLKTFICYKYSPLPIKDLKMQKLIEVCKRLEQFLDNSHLDIEFAMTDENEVYIFQVRPIVKGNKQIYSKLDLDKPLEKIYKKLLKLNNKHPFLLGEKTCFGVMPDWNPAEILGVRPKKLAISLYKELITDNIWAHQRSDYGYRDLTMHPLMASLCGIPYIDTRITFNSFIPRKLNNDISEKLVNYYIERLATYPSYHDKIEFEIVYSCYYFGISDKLRGLLDYGFTENEIKRIEFSLLELTNKIIHPETGLYKNDLKKIDVLKENYEKITQSDISTIDKIYWLIEECKEYGTLSFAGVARAAFIAVQFLQSFVATGIISNQEYDAYMNSLKTVNKQLKEDLEKLNVGKLEKNQILEKYGHIRPGTYDILSLRYDENFDEYFEELDQGENIQSVCEQNEFSFSKEQLKRIDMELIQNGLEVNSNELFCFIKEAIEGREYIKFEFTKVVSKILQLIEQLGRRLKIEKEDLAHLDIMVIKNLYVDLYYDDLSNVLNENIENNKKQYEYAQLIKLPSIIVEPEDIYAYYLLDDEPNFVGLQKVKGKIINDLNSEYLQGNIVFIQAADPGYDFLFSKGIGGLVTQFGGANSHMAIRCAELGIPAIIGAGEKNFNEWKKHKIIEIDCTKKKVIVK